MRQTGKVQLIGTSQVIEDLRAEVERVARSDAKVLITGESGSGKEVVARAIHDSSVRARVGFVPVNCAGIPETLLESELFGHVKGSFTGAYRDKPGKLEMADNGTIFLDEIGEMTLRMQGLLLRFLETGEIQKVGAERVAKATNVRVMAATNRNLPHLIVQGQFREDLFYRINVIHIVVPPLRERREDIPLLVDYFLTRFTAAQPEERQRERQRQSQPRAFDFAGGAGRALRVRLARQRPPGRERDRAARRHRPPRGGAVRRSLARDSVARKFRAAAASRTAPHGRRRAVHEAGRRARVLLERGLPAVHEPRDHAEQRP